MRQPTTAEIVKHHDYDPSLVDRVTPRQTAAEIQEILVIADPDPAWPSYFQLFKTAIEDALGSKTCLYVRHFGSTSIPGLPAKPIIDIEVVVSDVLDEDIYRPQLEAIGIEMRCRRPSWHQHRFFRAQKSEGKWPIVGNVHVFGEACPEVERHAIFREWLTENGEERERYVAVKREAMNATRKEVGDVMDYNLKKEKVVREILDRAFRARGPIE
jgi:GrpB-like predicted nucleotidyltransferase (UPF0157 family)